MRQRKPKATPPAPAPELPNEDRLLTAGALDGFDLQVLQIVKEHRGADQAASIAVIAARIWPEDYALYAGSRKWMANRARGIKAAVRALRRAGFPVGSTRGGSGNRPPGYFLIRTRDEMERTLGPLRRQALDMLVTGGRLAGAQDAKLKELAGQIRLALEPPAAEALQGRLGL